MMSLSQPCNTVSIDTDSIENRHVTLTALSNGHWSLQVILNDSGPYQLIEKKHQKTHTKLIEKTTKKPTKTNKKQKYQKTFKIDT